MGFDTGTLIGASSVLKAGGSLIGGISQNSAANAQAAQLDQQAANERDAATAKAESIRRAARYQTAQADSAYAGSGVSVATGTPVEVGRAIRKNAETDAYNAILTGQRQASTLEAQAAQTRAAGRSSLISGGVGGLSSVLSGGQQYSKWKSAKSSSVPVVDLSSYE